MHRLAISLVLFALAGCPDAQHGDRCNPLQYSSNGVQGDCAGGLACVYPTAPNCGVAYCCVTDSDGKIIDNNPNCQIDPSLAGPCMLDLGPTGDAGH